MKKMLVLVILLAGIGYLGLGYHFILFDDSLKILPKVELRTLNTFVDARGAKALRLVTQGDLVQAGVRDLVGQKKGLSIPIPSFK